MGNPQELGGEDHIEWNDEKNNRRCDLIGKEINGRLTKSEIVELALLQAEMLAYRRSVAPLPIDDLKKLKQKLKR